ncbi:hypothetical protein [Oceanobacillus locisalsi]|uniref:Uncharacterized protein n=1 Tax=Oceanobacillus locisalsi TaxID=546107 RepID=A0ABW3NJ57_9BACI
MTLFTLMGMPQLTADELNKEQNKEEQTPKNDIGAWTMLKINFLKR